MASDFDVLIAGGGPAGSALALALADGRRRIAVVEARSPVAGDSTRSIALSAGSARLLDALGVWPELAPGAVAIERVEVSQEGHYGRTRLDAADENLPALGYVVGH
ncbi:MAG: FAD-dependent monooxygenase, partial [Halofilum sp. (in: g-proteobacteria)]